MYVLERPGQTILYGSTFDESVLIVMNNFKNELLEPVCEEYRDDLEATV